MTRQNLRAVVTDQTALICTLLGECANEPLEGQVAVASVIRTRVKHPRWWGTGWRGVCLKQGQFSCWWEKNDNTKRVYELAEAMRARTDATGPLSIVGQLHWIASGVMDDMLLDNTGTSDHYLAAWLYQSDQCPSWARRKRPVARIGNHVFLRLEV